MALETLTEKFNKDNSKALAKIEKIVDPSIKAVEKAEKILAKLSDTNIPKIDQIERQLDEHKGILGGFHSQLAGLVKNKKAAYLTYLRNKAEAENTKYVAAAAEPEANLAVAPERRLRDKIYGKLDSAIGMIQTCRSLRSYAGKQLDAGIQKEDE
jgi:hypothetical protein